MTSNPPTTKNPLSTNHLSFMTKISPCAYFYKPEQPKRSTTRSFQNKNDPKLIILSAWMGARPAHIAKYLVPYRTLYPTSPILLLRSEPRHFLVPYLAPRELEPTVTFFKSIFPFSPKSSSSSDDDDDVANGGRQPPELLVHCFSNGGSLLFGLVRSSLLGCSGGLPPYAVIYDSTPGQFRYWPAYLAFTASLSGVAYWLVSPLMHLVVTFFYVWHVIIGRHRTGPLAKLARGHNDERLKGAETSRTYIYGKADRLVDWRDVEAHAAEAERVGFADVRREEFVGTGHVAHARGEGNETRYWGIVRRSWGRQEGGGR